MKKLFLLTIALFLTGLTGYSQTPDSAESTIDGQFQELIENSNNFKGYKVVDTKELTALQNLTSRRISELKEEITTSKEAALEQQKQTKELQAELQNLQAQLEQVSAEKDALTFLGFPFSKDSYKAMMWGIVGVLVLALIFFIYRFKKSHVNTQEARKRLEETEKEFEAFRAKALEKEQRMGRQLQYERNKSIKVSQ